MSSYLQAGLILATGTAVSVVAVVYFSQQRKDDSSRSPPNSSFFFGMNDLLRIILTGSFSKYLVKRKKEMNCGSFFMETPLFGKVLFVLDRKDVAAVFQQERKIELRTKLPPTVLKLHGHRAVQHLTGDAHKKWRKILSAIFSPRALNAYVPYLLKEFNLMWDQLAQQPSSFVLREEIRQAQLRVMSKMLYGIDAHNPADQADFTVLSQEFEKAIEGLFALESGTVFRNALESSVKVKTLLKRRFVERLQSERHQQPQDSSSTRKVFTDADYNALDAIIEELTPEEKANEDFLNEDIVDNLYLLLEASHSTSYCIN
jgi:cytochrome P450